MSLTAWLGFLLAAIIIAVTPGPGAVTSMSTGLRHGYGAALRAIAGLQTALLIQLAIVAGGLGALLAASTLAFDVIKFLGAAYLIWLGVQKWRAPAVAIDENGVVLAPRGLFWQGLLVNLSNPKAILFVAALVPQFIDPAQPQAPQFGLIAFTMCAVDILVMSCYALLAARLGGWLHDPRALQAQNRVFGGLFCTAGTLLALSSRPH